MIYKTLLRVEYERIILCQMANGIWKNLINFHQRKCQAKYDDISLELLFTCEVKSLERHLVKMDTCATSSIDFDIGNGIDKDLKETLEVNSSMSLGVMRMQMTTYILNVKYVTRWKLQVRYTLKVNIFVMTHLF